MPRKSRLNKLKETILAVQDLNRNYWDMKRDNTVKGDDYFHCKANYEATSRGVTGERVAKKLGNAKENFDYYYNQIWKGLSKKAALKDKAHDKAVNKTGRQRAKSGVYRNAEDACKLYRVRGINDKY